VVIEKMKILDLGSGPWKYSGSISVDWNKEVNPDIVWDLNVSPYPFNDDEFDLVYASHCLEHLDNPVKIIEEIWRILRPNGMLILKVPHFSCRTAYGILNINIILVVYFLIILKEKKNLLQRQRQSLKV
jgi:predicted SAM-dependent methyltransferase